MKTPYQLLLFAVEKTLSAHENRMNPNRQNMDQALWDINAANVAISLASQMQKIADADFQRNKQSIYASMDGSVYQAFQEAVSETIPQF